MKPVSINVTGQTPDARLAKSCNEYNSSVCYEMMLEYTIDGYMNNLGSLSYCKPYIEEYKVCFDH